MKHIIFIQVVHLYQLNSVDGYPGCFVYKPSRIGDEYCWKWPPYNMRKNREGTGERALLLLLLHYYHSIYMLKNITLRAV